LKIILLRINQYDNIPEVYIQYWNFLHGIRRFISQNKICYKNDDVDDLLDQINYTSDRMLYKCSTLTKSFFDKFLIYDASFSLESDRSLLCNDNSNSGDNGSASEFELIEIKNRAIQYHLAALNFLKNLMSSLKSLETTADIENAMVVNDELTEVLSEAEGHYQKFVVKFNYSKESLELYILFLRNSMNRNDLADKYIQMLEENENDDEKQEVQKGNQSAYERSERLSSSMTSDIESRKVKVLKKNVLHRCQLPLYKLLNVMQVLTTMAIVIGIIGNIIYYISFSKVISNIEIFTTVTHSPTVVSDIKYSVRMLSLATAAGIDPTDLQYAESINRALGYIEYAYIPVIYKSHTIESQGYVTINPVENGIVDRLLDMNYFKTLTKIDRKARIILGRLNNTEIRNPDYLDNKDIRYFMENSKGQFGELLLNSIDMMYKKIDNVVTNHLNTFFIVSAFVVVFMGYVIINIIIPYTNKSFGFVRSIISLYRTLPSKYFNEQSSEYSDQIQELCENYDIEDEGIGKKKKKNKKPSSIGIKKYFTIYCFIVIILILLPFCTVFLFNYDCRNIMNLLVHSTKRGYYLSSINILSTEVILNDNKYYGKGEALRLMMDRGTKLQVFFFYKTYIYYIYIF